MQPIFLHDLDKELLKEDNKSFVLAVYSNIPRSA